MRRKKVKRMRRRLEKFRAPRMAKAWRRLEKEQGKHCLEIDLMEKRLQRLERSDTSGLWQVSLQGMG
jgi:hypothetical protein